MNSSDSRRDPPSDDDNPFMTKVDCLKVHLRLEKRLGIIEGSLSNLKLLNAGSIIAAVATLLGIAYIIWQFASGGR